MAKQETNKPLSLADLSLEAFKNKDEVKPSFSPGIATEFDLDKTSQELGASNRPELGTNAMNELSQQFQKEKAYNDAKNKADEQGFFGESLGALNQLVVGELIGGTVEGVGYLMDWDQIENMEAGTQSFGKMISDAGKGLREWSQEATPIYVDPDDQGQFKPWSYEWWASNIPSVGSALSILIPVAGEARAVALIGEGAAALRTAATLGKLGKSARTIGKILDTTLDAAKAITPELSYATKMSAKGLHRAAVSTHIEAMMEATGTFKEEYDKLITNGIPEDQAKQLAGKSASFVYKANWANLATDFMQQMFLLKSVAKVTKGVIGTAEAEAAGVAKNLGKMAAAKKYSKQFLSEGFEEAYQFVIQEEGKYMSDIEAGLAKKEGFSDRLDKYLGQGELWTSAFFGGLGGVAFEKYGNKLIGGVQKKFLGKTGNYVSYEQARLDDLKSQTARALQSVETLGKARETGNESAIRAAENNMALNLGVTSAQNETLDYMLDRFDNLKNLTDEERQAKGIPDDFVQNIDRYKKNITDAAVLYAENTKRYGPEISEALTNREYNLNRLTEQLPQVNQNYDKLVTSLPRYTETTAEGRHLLDEKIVSISGEKTIRYYQERLKDTELTDKAKIDLQEQLINAIESHELEMKKFEALADTYKSSINNADKLVLNAVEGKKGEDLVDGKLSLNLHTNTIRQLSDELSYLTSRKGLEEYKAKYAAYQKENLAKKQDEETVEQVANQDNVNYSSEENSELGGIEDLDSKIKSGEITEDSLDEETREALESYRTGAVKSEVALDEASEANATTISFSNITDNSRTDKEKTEIKQTINKTVNFEEPETPENKNQFFGSEYESNSKLASINALAWKSAYQLEAKSDEKTPKNIALTNFLENPDTSLEGIELRFSIDSNYIENEIKIKKAEFTTSLREIKSALDNKKIPENIGKVPIKATLYRNNRAIEYGGQTLELFLHDDTYGGYKDEIKQQAETEIKTQKTLIVEAFLQGKQYSSNILNKGNGSILTKKTNNDFAKNSLVGQKDSLFKTVNDVQFTIGINKRFVNPIDKSEDFSVLGNEADNGAFYAKVKTANGSTFPLRLHIGNLTVEEADLVFDLYTDLLTNPEAYKQNISKEIIASIRESKERIINEIPTYLNLDNTTYEELLNNLVYNGYSKTANAGNSRLFMTNPTKEGKPAMLVFAKTKGTALKNLAETKEEFIKYLTTARRRQVSAKLLNDENYKKYIINNSIVTTNAYTNEAGRAFVQPTIVYNPNFKLITESKEDTSKTVSLNPKPSKEVLQSTDIVNDIPKENDALEMGATTLSLFSPLQTLPSEKTETPKEINKSTSISETEKEKLRKEAEKLLEEDGDDSVFKLTTKEIAEQNTQLSQKELDKIRSILPKAISIKLENDYIQVLDNGKVAIGLFKDNMIYLSKNGNSGTGYHEAFHAIFRSVLNNKERVSLYREATKNYVQYTVDEINEIKKLHNINDAEAVKIYYEEQMADDFMNHMLADLPINNKQYSTGIAGFFQRMFDWIKNVFSNSITTKKLFRDIAMSKYADKEVNISRGVAYKATIRIPKTGDLFEANEIKEITQQLTYIALAPGKNEKFENLKDLKSIRNSKIKNELLKHGLRSNKVGNTELEERAYTIVKEGNFEFFIGKVEEYLSSMGISETVEKVVEDESGNIMYTPSYETSGKDSASKEVKLLVALTPKFLEYNINDPSKKKYDLNTYLGLPKFENFGETWNKLENNLHSIVPIYKEGKLVDSFEQMLDKLTEMSKYHPSLGFIKNKLLDSDVHIQNQFHVVFSRYKGIYVDALLSGTPRAMSYKISSSDSFSKNKEISAIWADNFRKNFGVYSDSYKNIIYDQTKLDKLVKLHIDLFNSLQEDRKGRVLKDHTISLLKKELSALGVNLSDQALSRAIDNQEFSVDTPSELIRLNKVNTFIAKLDKAILSYKGYRGLIDTYKDGVIENPRRAGVLTTKYNHILDQQFFTEELANYQSEFIKSPGENTIISAGGNTTWTFQDNNLMSKTVNAINTGDVTYLNMIKDSPWNTNSLWINKLLNSQSYRDKLEINLYNNYKDTDTNDSGDKAKDLKEADKLNDTINKYLSGTFIGLAEADKSQQYYIKGFDLESSQVTMKDGNVILTGNNAINILTNYFVSEITRMNSVFEQLENKIEEKDQIMYMHYNLDKKGNKIEGNWSKSYLFPNMDLFDMGILHKSAVEGSNQVIAVSKYDNLSKENKDKIKDYISEQFISAVKGDLNKLSTYNIIKQKEDKSGYENLTIDKSKVDEKYNGDTSFAVGDYTLNSIIANIEFTKLFTQDPALYKRKGDSFEDFRKRIPAIIASGKDQRIFKSGKYEVRESYSSAVIENIITPSEYFGSEENISTISEATGLSVEKVKDIFDAYKKTNETDAQAWITIDLFRERMLAFGKWNEEAEESFDRVKDNKATKADLAFFSQPLKTVHSEIKIIAGIATMQYNKQSEAVLLPHIVEQLNIGNILQSMIDNKVDHIITLDGKKVGATIVSSVRDNTGKMLEAKDIKLQPIALSNRFLFLQQDLPTKGIKDTLVGSQAVKNVMAMLDMTKSYEGLTGLEVYNEYHKVISQLSNLGLVDIKKKVGFNDNANKITDFSNLNREISKELKDSASSNVIDAIRAGTPFDAIVQFKTKIQNKFAAMISKQTVKLKQLGGSMIQTSSFGYNANDIKLNDKVKDGIIWFKNPKEQLQPARLLKNKDGEIRFKAAQVLLPHSKIIEKLKEAKVIENHTEMTHEELRSFIAPEVLKGLSYRIPNQGPASNDAFEIVGILPPEMGDTIIAYKEITVKTGSDFDIDKAFIILPHFFFNPKTNRLENTKDDSKEGLQNRRLKLMQDMLSNTSGYTQLMSPLDAPWLKDLIYGTDTTEGLLKQDNSIADLYFFTGTNQILTKSLFDGAKTLVGVIAKHMTHHNLTKHENVRYNDYYIGKGPKYNEAPVEGVDNQIMNSSFLSTEKDEEGNSVEETLIAYANAIVDAAKDPFVLKANINQFTANTTFMLARSGVDREWISAFMLQPILVDLVTEMSISEGRIAPEDRNTNGELISSLDRVLTKYNSTISGKEFKKAPKGLDKDDSGNILITTDRLKNQIGKLDKDLHDYPFIQAEQRNILGQFIEWQNKAKSVSDLMKATASDTDGATKNATTATMRDNLLNMVVDSETFTGLQDFIGYKVEEGQKIFTDSRMIGTFHKNSVQFMMKISKQLFISSSDSFKHSIFNIAKYAGYDFLQDEEVAKLIENELYAALISKSNIISFENKQELLSLLFNTEKGISLGERILEAKNKYPDNDLIQSLAVRRGIQEIGEPTTISLSPKSLDKEAKDNLYLHWEDILVQDKQLGEDLIKYAYYSSGLSTNFGVFFEHIPSNWLATNGMNDFIKLQLGELNTSLHKVTGLEDQVFRHLYKNNKIVPTISNKIIRTDVKLENNMPVSPEHFIVIDEFNAGNLKLKGKNNEGNSEYKRFIKTKNTISTPTPFDPSATTTVIKLYKLKGYKENQSTDKDPNKTSRVLIYERTNPLGINRGTDIIKEYGENSESIFEVNKVSIPENIYNTIDNDSGLIEPDGIINMDETMESQKENKSDEDQSNEFFYCKRPD